MFSGINPGSLLLILLIVVLVFGTKKLTSLGTDIGGAIKGFKKAMTEEEKAEAAQLSNDESKKSADSVKQSSDASSKT